MSNPFEGWEIDQVNPRFLQDDEGPVAGFLDEEDAAEFLAMVKAFGEMKASIQSFMRISEPSPFVTSMHCDNVKALRDLFITALAAADAVEKM